MDLLEFMIELDIQYYLALFKNEENDFIYNKIKYQTGVKSGITYVISHSYDKV